MRKPFPGISSLLLLPHPRCKLEHLDLTLKLVKGSYSIYISRQATYTVTGIELHWNHADDHGPRLRLGTAKLSVLSFRNWEIVPGQVYPENESQKVLHIVSATPSMTTSLHSWDYQEFEHRWENTSPSDSQELWFQKTPQNPKGFCYWYWLYVRSHQNLQWQFC